MMRARWIAAITIGVLATIFAAACSNPPSPLDPSSSQRDKKHCATDEDCASRVCGGGGYCL